MKNGFIYPIFSMIVEVCKYLNLVEYVKLLANVLLQGYSPSKIPDENAITRKNIGIDFFMLLKWTFVVCLIVWDADHWVWKYVVIYLIASNLFTYFYYHAWGSSFSQRSDEDAVRRRLLNFFLSTSFFVVCYAYLYQFHYASQISWPDYQANWMNALYLSVSTSFTLTFGDSKPTTQDVRLVFLTELVNTFLFFSIIISNSIPSISNKD